MVVLGYLEDKFGFFEEETRVTAKRNPYFSQILEKLEDIDKRIKKLEKKK